MKIRARNLLAAWTNDPGCTPRKLQVPHVWCGEGAFDLGVKLTAGQAQLLGDPPPPRLHCNPAKRACLVVSLLIKFARIAGFYIKFSVWASIISLGGVRLFSFRTGASLRGLEWHFDCAKNIGRSECG